MQITVKAACATGYDWRPEQFTIEVPDNATDDEINKLANAEAINYLDVSWKRPRPTTNTGKRKCQAKNK